MKEINRTNTCVSFKGNNRFANIVRDTNNSNYFKVVTKSEAGTIKTIATRCDYSTAYNLVKEFIEK